MTSVTSTTSSTAATSASSVSSAVYAKVESVMSSQSTGVAKLNTALTADQTKLSGLGQLQSALSDFQTVALSLAGDGLATAATPSDPSVLSATTTSAAVSGTYAVNVSQLAQGQQLVSGALASASTAIGTGSSTVITVATGTTSGSSFTAGSAASVSVTIDSSNNTLAGIAAAFQKAGVNATVVQNGSGYSLSIAGADGSASSMKISANGDASVASLVSYDPAKTGGLTQASAAQDAVLTVDGKQITSASNDISDAITGTTLSLTATGSSNVVVAHDNSQIATNIASFVSAYNTLATKIATLKGSDLQSDTALNQASQQLSSILSTGGDGSSAYALKQAGVSLDSTGQLQIDQTKLSAALASDPDSLSKLFTNDGKGIADQLASTITTLTGDSGQISKELTVTNAGVTALTAKKATIQTALTAQATALAALYTQQEDSSSWWGSTDSSSSSSSSSTPTSLFDILA